MTDETQAAVEAAGNAYCPYSGFHVGALVVAEDGRAWSGCNVENAAYGASVCAEVNALTTAVAAGHSGPSRVIVACVDASGLDQATPCGNCRQFMHELGVTRVTVTVDGSESKDYEMAELLPDGFKL